MHPKTLLDQYGLQPKKSLGQNFLFDEGVLARIAATADITPSDTVLEIGPGLGALTHVLAQQARRVVAVELDQRFLPVLRDELTSYSNVEVIHGDILDQDPAALFSAPYKVVANVPYYITGAILRHLLGAPHKPTLLVMTVQKEVAERVTAVPPNMTLLAVSVQFYGTPRLVSTIKAGAFWPRPDVDSAVLRIDLNQFLPDTVGEAAFFRVAKAGFGQKRKQLQKNLRQLGFSRNTLDSALARSSIDGSRRAETLTLDEWRALAAALYPAPNKEEPDA